MEPVETTATVPTESAAIETEAPLVETPDESKSTDDVAASAAAEEAAFNAVMGEEGQPATTTTEPASDEGAEPASSQSSESAPQSPAEPVLAKISEADWKKAIEGVTKIEEISAALEKRFGTAFGKIGALEGVLKQLQAATPAGQAIQVTEADFDEMLRDFPDLTAMQVKGLNRALSRMKGTGAAPMLDPAKIEEIVDQRIRARDESRAIEQMTKRRTNWDEIVGPADSKTPYRQWLGTQTPEYQRMIAETWDPEVVDKSIDTFLKQSQQKSTKPSAPGDSRRRVLEGGVTPRSAGAGPGPKPKTEEDYFAEGFNSE